MRSLAPDAEVEIQAVIDAHRAELMAVPGVLGAEPGFPVVGGQIVREPAIILYVKRKLPQSHLPAEDQAPRSVDGYRVDVAQVDPWKQLELQDGLEEFSAALGGADGGTAYVGLPGDPIDIEATVSTPLLCHAGPDAGWPVLKAYLAKGKDTLTVAMYDFSARHIFTTLAAAAKAEDWRVTLTLDDTVAPAEQAIQADIKAKLGQSYQASIIHCGADRRFPSAYHPKVAVQDSKRFWISSGNWSPRSQPDIDPIGKLADANGMYSRGNREWHLVVDDGPLAKLFERYIRHDKEQADADAALGVEVTAFPDLLVPLDALMAEAADAALAAPTPVAPKQLPATPKPIKVRPLLSPDNYAPRVTEWIKGAQTRLYLQYAYITYSKAAKDAAFRALLDHLGELSWKADFDLRIIVSAGADEKIRVLAQNGFNEKVIRVQSTVHNKGIVRDGDQVLVSSQNWSGDGFLRNRDAGLIIADPEIAGYFEDIFLSDWDLRARQPFSGAGLSAVIAEPGAPTPAGMVRMAWSDVFGD